MSKRITTCLDDELWRRAMMGNVSWTEALRIGIMIKLGDNSVELNQFREKIRELDAEKRYYENKIKETEDKIKRDAETESVVKNNLPLLGKAVYTVNKNIKFLKGQVRIWNSHTKMVLSEEEFYQLCQRYERGEFDVKKMEVKS